ncbi:PLC-A protein [Penicillium waksmanii]|uniref:PLC-A protein n=1 Tax=Penicillium waksmanii TaxID=69791 RepID=UPI002546C209|nr:PLC-A protein [Penicillium waksmanii]KAJ5975915.1 PLC-A protein [Penicillium waksmanii]
MLISPWVEKGVVEHKASKNDYTHTSILSFVSELWGLDPLTPRVEWSPSFSSLITNKYRDSPETLPNAAGYPLKHQLHSH